MPNITTLARLSGTEAVVAWQPYTLDTAKGFLTTVELAYQSVPVTSRNCPTFNNPKVININVNQSMYRFTDLQAEEEYCVAVRGTTAIGPSEYSVQQKLPCKVFKMLERSIKLIITILCDCSVRIFSLPSSFQTATRCLLH